jgi:hypothetical protein
MTETDDKYSKERIAELVSRLRGTGGLPLAPSLSKNLNSWLGTMARRGYLKPEFLKDKDLIASEFMKAYPKPSSRSHFAHAILQYFAALTDDEFAEEYGDLSRWEAVHNVKAVAGPANKDVNEKGGRTKRGCL